MPPTTRANPSTRADAAHGENVTHIAFADKQPAMVLEAYLNSGSGRAFANKRLWNSVAG